MQVDFLRHGIAVERSANCIDHLRPLNKRGQIRTRAIANTLKHRGDRWDVVLHSPLVRARQTAEIMVACGLGRRGEEFSALAPCGEFEDLVRWSQAHPHASHILVVGHQPDLGQWIELAVWGQASGAIQLKKAGIGRVRFPARRLRHGSGVLLEIITPKTLLLASAK